MLYYVERDMLIVVSKQHMLSQYTLVDNKPVQIYQAKLSVGKEGLHDAIWAGDGQLAIVSADQVVRVSNLPCDDNYVLSLADVPGAEGAEAEDEHMTDKLVSLAYHAEAGLLAFDFDRLRGLGGSVLSAFPMLSGQRDTDPREP